MVDGESEIGYGDTPPAPTTDVVPRAPPKKKRKYRQIPRPKLYARDREWHLRNRDKVREYQAKYNIDNRERLASYAATYRKEHREESRIRGIAYRAKHPELRLKKIQTLYGITPMKYMELFQRQGGKCAICGKVLVFGHGRNGAYIDHNHTNGKVRGFLCSFCNSILGYCFDNPTILRDAISYLLNHEGGATD